MGEKRFWLAALPAGHGDCLWIHYGSAAVQKHILIDGGVKRTAKRLASALADLEGSEPSHELLVITHIDDDHIAGALALLEGGYAHHFAQIWFNGRVHLDPSAEFEGFGPAQGERLTTALLAVPDKWNQSFLAREVALNESGNPKQVSLGGGLVVTVLSPGWAQLEALAGVWDTVIEAANLNPAAGVMLEPNADTEYEALGSAAIDVDALAEEEVDEDDKEANCSSIVLLLEFEGKRMLLGADAKPSVVVQAVKRLTGGAPLPVDLLKLPHHGSRNNVTRELLETVPSKRVVVSTDGARFHHPDLQGIARVIKYSPRGVELVFNVKSEFNKMWASKRLQKKWGYAARYGSKKDGARVDLL